jgi:hypothetical protein
MTDSMQDGDGAIQIGYYFAFLLNSGPNSFAVNVVADEDETRRRVTAVPRTKIEKPEQLIPASVHVTYGIAQQPAHVYLSPQLAQRLAN